MGVVCSFLSCSRHKLILSQSVSRQRLGSPPTLAAPRRVQAPATCLLVVQHLCVAHILGPFRVALAVPALESENRQDLPHHVQFVHGHAIAYPPHQFGQHNDVALFDEPSPARGWGLVPARGWIHRAPWIQLPLQQSGMILLDIHDPVDVVRLARG